MARHSYGAKDMVLQYHRDVQTRTNSVFIVITPVMHMGLDSTGFPLERSALRHCCLCVAADQDHGASCRDDRVPSAGLASI